MKTTTIIFIFIFILFYFKTKITENKINNLQIEVDILRDKDRKEKLIIADSLEFINDSTEGLIERINNLEDFQEENYFEFNEDFLNFY